MGSARCPLPHRLTPLHHSLNENGAPPKSKFPESTFAFREFCPIFAKHDRFFKSFIFFLSGFEISITPRKSRPTDPSIPREGIAETLTEGCDAQSTVTLATLTVEISSS